MQRTRAQVYDCQSYRKNPAELLGLLLQHADASHFKSVTIHNAHLMGRELDYILLNWRNPPEFHVDALYGGTHPLLEAHGIPVDVLEDSGVGPDVSGLETAWTTKNSAGMRDWFLKTFAQGHDPATWVPRLAEGPLKVAMESALETWRSIVYYGTTLDHMRQAVLFYATALISSSER